MQVIGKLSERFAADIRAVCLNFVDIYFAICLNCIRVYLRQRCSMKTASIIRHFIYRCHLRDYRFVAFLEMYCDIYTIELKGKKTPVCDSKTWKVVIQEQTSLNSLLILISPNMAYFNETYCTKEKNQQLTT